MAFTQFIKEKHYLQNVTPATVEWYTRTSGHLSRKYRQQHRENGRTNYDGGRRAEEARTIACTSTLSSATLSRMFWQTNWFQAVRAVAELIYFASGITIAIAAFLALRQISLTKKIAKTNARRESIRFAADLCKYFAETVSPKLSASNQEHNTLNLKYLLVKCPQGQPPFVIENGEITKHHFDLRQLAEDFPKHKSSISTVNFLEAFAIPFVARVADDEIGYRETARAFCKSAEVYMPVIFQLRTTNSGRFESVVTLYEIWNARLFAEMSAPTLKAMQEAAKKAESGQIKPIDFDS